MALSDTTQKFKPVIVVHGGAWAVPDDKCDATLDGVKEAAKIGYRILCDGRTSTDAVVAVVSALEDNPLFDAGKGCTLNSAEDIEMHAIVMEGNTVNSGGVIGLQNVKNPVQVARLVMEKTNHNILDGKAGLALAREYKLQEMPKEYFVTEHMKEELQNLMKYNTVVNTLFNRQENLLDYLIEKILKPDLIQFREHDTVGAVALDAEGNLACATSTGGITGQMPGRVSDSPIPGAGGYADNDSIAISTTGHGESILRVSLARMASFYAAEGYSPQQSVEKSLLHMKSRVGGYGGAIAVNRQGKVGVAFTTTKMSWTIIGDELQNADDTKVKLRCGILPGETRTEMFSV